jgi:hypothetical protein
VAQCRWRIRGRTYDSDPCDTVKELGGACTSSAASSSDSSLVLRSTAPQDAQLLLTDPCVRNSGGRSGEVSDDGRGNW